MQDSTKPMTVSTADGIRHLLRNDHATVCMLIIRPTGTDAPPDGWQRFHVTAEPSHEPATCLWCWSTEGVWPQAALP